MFRPRDRELHLDWIAEQLDRMGQFFCSMATGYTTALVAMKRIVGFGLKNHLYRAIRELGRVLGEIDPGEDVPVDLLGHVSAISWENIVLYG